MLTPKQNLLETLKKDGKPECLCNSLTMFRTIPGDPCFKLLRGNRVRGTNSYLCHRKYGESFLKSLTADCMTISILRV